MNTATDILLGFGESVSIESVLYETKSPRPVSLKAHVVLLDVLQVCAEWNEIFHHIVSLGCEFLEAYFENLQRSQAQATENTGVGTVLPESWSPIPLASGRERWCCREMQNLSHTY